MECIPVPDFALEAIAEGLRRPDLALESAVAVQVAEERRDETGWPVFIVAARITGPTAPGGVVAVWAVGDIMKITKVGPIAPVGGDARKFSVWYEAATYGSRAEKLLLAPLVELPEVEVARNCVERA